MNTPKDRDHLSYSQVNTYLTCPLRYNFQYIEKIPAAFTSASLAFGTSIHEAVGAFYHEHLLGEELRPDQMLDVYRQAWLGAEKVKFFNGDNENSLLNKAEQLLAVFHNAFDPDAAILGIEEFFEIQLSDVPPVHGYIDLIEQSPDGMVAIVDLKTASKKLSESSVHQNLQLTAYSLGAAALGFEPDNLALRLDVLLKTKNPEMIRYQTTRTDDDRSRFVRLVQQVWNGIQREVWFPREDWHCSQCAWTKQCSEW